MFKPCTVRHDSLIVIPTKDNTKISPARTIEIPKRSPVQLIISLLCQISTIRLKCIHIHRNSLEPPVISCRSYIHVFLIADTILILEAFSKDSLLSFSQIVLYILSLIIIFILNKIRIFKCKTHSFFCYNTTSRLSVLLSKC